MQKTNDKKAGTSFEDSVQRKLKGEINALELIEDSPMYEDFMQWCANRGVEADDDSAQLFIDMSEESALRTNAAADPNEQ